MSSDLLTTLQRELGPDAVRTGTAVSRRYHVDFSHEDACAPLAVLLPRSTAEVAAILRECDRAGQPIVVQGGLTGLAGGATPQAGELAISLERLTGVEAVDHASQTLTVLAGTPLQTVQRAAADAGYMFPLDLGARGSCTIGGNIATNAGGNQVLRFGMMRNLVLGLEAVLADGTIVSSMNRMLKNNAGYDLKQLFIGTEGTLGIVTRAVLRLFPKLPGSNTALCAVTGFDAALGLLHLLQGRLGGRLSAFEAMWASYFDYVLAQIDTLQSPFKDKFPLYVLVAVEGADGEHDRGALEDALQAALDAGIIVDAAVAQAEREARSFWAIRDAIGEVTPSLQPLLAYDVSLPTEAMPAFLARVDAELAGYPAKVTNLVFGHLGDQNLHLAITTHAARDAAPLNELVYAAVGAYGGSIAAEHGIGTHRRPYLRHSRSAAEIMLMRRLKTALDPREILNRGRVLPSR